VPEEPRPCERTIQTSEGPVTPDMINEFSNEAEMFSIFILKLNNVEEIHAVAAAVQDNWKRKLFPEVHPVLFLDVDGVLNRNGKSDPTSKGLEPDKMAFLGEIIDKANPHIVVSSTWRKFDKKLEQLKTAISDLGGRYAGETPVLDQQTPGGIYTATVRGAEIKAWKDEHPGVGNFVIVDDGSDMEPYMDHLVQTGVYEGLTLESTNEIIKRLNHGSRTTQN